MDLGLISLLVILVLAIVIVFTVPEPMKTRFAEVGGTAFLLWLLVRLVGSLMGRT